MSWHFSSPGNTATGLATWHKFSGNHSHRDLTEIQPGMPYRTTPVLGDLSEWLPRSFTMHRPRAISDSLGYNSEQNKNPVLLELIF